METKIFDDYGVEIFKRSGKYFICVDSGEMASRLVEAEISMSDATLAQQGPQKAYDVLMKYKNMGLFKNVEDV
ncbi:hypothetical protein IZU99_03190 [Oscillospiraceae bacterium CM]|nr:hypothetical protein IZU99_03190 [Oscillospiraceae bacterium CM]